tara:strand:- start:791 stop:1225 length:435 start_codon:yes stop_codon:yes gene_type:complete
MDIAGLLVRFVLAYYILYLIQLIFNKKIRIKIKAKNKKLDGYRRISIKTVEQQKEFLNVKYPKKTTKWKFTWKWLGLVVVKIGIFFAFVQLLKYVFLLFGLTFTWGKTILFVILFPLLINYILSKCKLEKSDMMSMLKLGGDKK